MLNTTTGVVSKLAPDQRAAATLSTLAFLKASWDTNRRDFVENYVNLFAGVFLAFREHYQRGVEYAVIRADLREHYGLNLPEHAIRTVCVRAKRRKLLRQDNHSLWVDWALAEKLAQPTAQRQFDALVGRVRTAYSEFCRDALNFADGADEALDALLGFLKHYDAEIVISAASTSVLPDVKQSREVLHRFSRFVKHVYLRNPDCYQDIVTIAVGHIAATSIVCEHIESFQGRLRDTTFFLDTGIIIRALGHETPEQQVATREFLEALKEGGATLAMFEHTRDELEKLLEGCKPWVGKLSFDESKASLLCILMNSRGVQASDIEHYVATLDRDISAIGVSVVAAPDPNVDTEFQIKEDNLRDLIVIAYQKNKRYFDFYQKQLTIDRDVKSIAAIYKLRKGRNAKHLGDAKYVFITTNGTLAGVSIEMEKQLFGEDYRIPACLTDLFVGAVVWAQSPNTLESANEQRLIAECCSLLEPTKEFIRRYSECAQQLRAQNRVTEDDLVLLKGDKLARELLMDATFGNPEMVQPKLVVDIVASTREKIREHDKRLLADEQMMRKRLAGELADEAASRLQTANQLTELKTSIAHKSSWVIAGLLCVPWIILLVNRDLHWIWTVLAMLPSFLVGTNLLDLRHKLEQAIFRQL